MPSTKGTMRRRGGSDRDGHHGEGTMGAAQSVRSGLMSEQQGAPYKLRGQLDNVEVERLERRCVCHELGLWGLVFQHDLVDEVGDVASSGAVLGAVLGEVRPRGGLILVGLALCDQLDLVLEVHVVPVGE